MSVAAHHNDWLNLVEVSGPFLALPVLMDALPAGLDKPGRELTADLWRAFTEWSDEDHGGATDPAVHEAWVRYVLEHVLEFDTNVLVREGDALDTWAVEVPEHDTRLTPDLVMRDPEDEEGTARLLVTVVAPDVSVTEPPEAGWSASPAERMESLLKGVEARLGIVSNGDQWTLVHVAEGENTGFATWYASLWREEPLTLRAFITLLAMRRFFAVAENETLDALLDRSREDQQGVTTQLGKQVRRAIEILIQQIDRVDHDRDGRLLEGMTEERLYESAVTVMMRLIFLFYAEENDLLLLGDDFYDQNYAASTLREQLQATADESGEEILERFHDAWPRLLSTFRAVHTGVEHEQMRLPAYGGALFDPDRYPFLEGREPDTTWLDETADPLPIDNRTVLHLLNAIQTLEVKVPGGGRENRPLSFRALDVEQIGHVYETLLDHTAVRAEDWIFGLEGTKDKEPEVPLGELEARADNQKELVKYLKDETGRSAGALKKRVAAEDKAVYDRWGQRWTPAFQGDEGTARRATPWGLLVREDSAEHPVVVPPRRVYVTESERRRSSGTHYTPRSLTEEIVTHALEPLVYDGPAEGKDRSDWELRSPDEILDLKVCDPACGSGAFLVQACRYLAERLVEAWTEHDAWDGPDGHALPVDPEERQIVARRYVVDRCLYGVDINPLATEMAKLSLWLVTLQKNRPFTFLDHAIRHGDSLLGVTDFETLEAFGVSHGQTQLWSQYWAPQLQVAREVREDLRSFAALNVEDIYRKQRLLDQSAQQLTSLYFVANAVSALRLSSKTLGRRKSEEVKTKLGELIGSTLGENDLVAGEELEKRTRALLDIDLPESELPRRPFHWLLEFPELAIGSPQGGFDAIIGNPPFLGGTSISGAFGGEYLRSIARDVLDVQSPGRTDYVVYFIRRGSQLLRRQQSVMGYVTTDNVTAGDSMKNGLRCLREQDWVIYRAYAHAEWPGAATQAISKTWLARRWAGELCLDGEAVNAIGSDLRPALEVLALPQPLASNVNLSYEGAKPYGTGFVLDIDEAKQLLDRDARYHEVVRPFVGGDDVSNRPDQMAGRYILYLEDGSPRYFEEEYPLAWEMAEQRVKPDRVPSDPDEYAKKLRDYPGMVQEWWRYWRPRTELHSQAKKCDHVLALSRVSKYGIVSRIPVQQGAIFADTLTVFPIEDPDLHALLVSGIHWHWALKWAPRRGQGVRYTPRKCFETLPRLSLSSRSVELAEDLHRLRRGHMVQHGIGLTDLYGRFHDPDCEEPGIVEMRTLLQELDVSILDDYSIGIRPHYGFHTSSLQSGVRYEWSTMDLANVLSELLRMNLESSERGS